MTIGATVGRAPPSTKSTTMRVRVKSLIWENVDTISMHLIPVDQQRLPAFDPGAHIDLHTPSGVIRQYSISSSCMDTTSYRLGVRIIPGGKSSAFIQSELHVGDILNISSPRNNFLFEVSKEYLFIAGGIGITPLLPMIAKAESMGTRWRLLFCNRTLAGAPFLSELQLLRGNVRLHISDEGTRLNVAEALAEVRPNTLVYCCGPDQLMSEVESATLHWPASSVRFEWFIPRAHATDKPSDGFDVICRRSGRSVRVQPNQSIIDALAVLGIDVPKSCEQGICGTCEVKVLDGEIDHRDSILSRTEKASNKSIMICVSRAKGRAVVLDI
jgi:ferredoxin-NADP reductase